MTLRVATFNLENFGDEPAGGPSLEARIKALKPVLRRLDADILCLQEVNAQGRGEVRALRALDRLLDGTGYESFERASTTAESGDRPRDVHNLVTLTRFPILARRQVLNDLVQPPRYRKVTARPQAKAPEAVQWDRPMLHTRIDAGAARPLDVVNVHLRAPLSAFVEGQKAGPFVWKSVPGWAEGFYLSSLKRNGQALEVRLFIDGLFDADEDALIAVCGDFNAADREVPVALLRADVEDTGNPVLASRTLVPLERSLPEGARFTVRHSGRKVMLDHILVSRALLAHFEHADVFNEALGDEMVAFAAGRRDAESFHAPVVAVFRKLPV